MDIETDYQSNCSELVTHLGLLTLTDIKKALRSIAEALPGWRICAEGHLPDELVSTIQKDVFFPVDDFSEVHWVARCYDNEVGKNLESYDELSPFENPYIALMSIEDYKRKYLEVFSTGEAFLKRAPGAIPRWLAPCIIKTNSKGPILDYPHDGECLIIDYNYEDWGAKGLTIGPGQHCIIKEFPVFHAILGLFKSEAVAHDGGSTTYFDFWVDYWVNEKEIEEPGDDELEEMEEIKNYPPIKLADRRGDDGRGI